MRTRQTQIVFRVDANSVIGVGHAMRCLSLATKLQKLSCRTFFFSEIVHSGILDRIKREGIETVSANGHDFLKFVRDQQTDWVVLDQPELNGWLQKELLALNIQTLIIDDNGYLEDYSANLVLNQNIYATKKLYECSFQHTRLLLGAPYILLRDEFISDSNAKVKVSSSPSKILITLGGSDTSKPLLRLIDCLSQVSCRSLEFTVVAADGAESTKTQIYEIFKNSSHTLHFMDYTENLCELMLNADVGITAAGTTCWEMAHLGLPILTIILVESQVVTASAIESAGIGINLGWWNSLTAELLREKLQPLLEHPQKLLRLSKCGTALVDGFGTKRVAEAMKITGYP